MLFIVGLSKDLLGPKMVTCTTRYRDAGDPISQDIETVSISRCPQTRPNCSRQKIFETCHRRITHGKFNVSTKSSPPSFATASTVGRFPRGCGRRGAHSAPRSQKRVAESACTSETLIDALSICTSQPKSVSVFLNQVLEGFILDRTIKILACNHSVQKVPSRRNSASRHLGTARPTNCGCRRHGPSAFKGASCPRGGAGVRQIYNGDDLSRLSAMQSVISERRLLGS